jgi:hypothetical protein
MSDDFHFELIINAPEVIKVKRLVETFFINYHRAPRDLKIDIVQYNDKFFIGVCNYGIWGPHQAEPYKNSRPSSSVIEALNDTLRGIQTLDSASIPNELIFWVSCNETVYDGNGELITLKEARKRRSNNKKKFSKVEWTQAIIDHGPWWLVIKNIDSKKFSVTGPVSDDTEYAQKAEAIKEKGIDFRAEMIPVTRQTKDEIIDYLVDGFHLQLVSEEDIFTV